jgi:hypothetical protein
MSKIKLKTSHLYIDSDLAAAAFGDTAQVYAVYYKAKNSLLLAPMNDEFFPKLHKAGLLMLKSRNLQGDKTIAMHEILIDNDINDENRDLEYQYTEGVELLNVKL